MKRSVFFSFFLKIATLQHLDFFNNPKLNRHFGDLSVDYNKYQNYFSFTRNYTERISVLKRSFNNYKISQSCRKQFNELLYNDPADLWNIFDSSSKFPWSGIQTSSTKDWGVYDQCININHDYDEGNIKGKYCVAGLLIPIDISKMNGSHITEDMFYKLAICMPNHCTAADFNTLFNITLFQDGICHTKDDLEKYTLPEIFMIVLLVIFAILMILSTIYDVIIKRYKWKSAHPLMLAFSVYANGKKILRTSKGNNKEQIQVFNGMKSISMAWVIAGHGMVGWNNFALINDQDYVKKSKSLSAFYIGGAQLAVDTFFYMGGFLLAYTYMKQKNKPLFAQIKSLPFLVIHRYVRLTPAVAMMYFVYITIFRHLGTGPLWDSGYKAVIKPCHTYWYSFFFYTQNYVNYNDVCLIHTWYLSADMQMFLVTSILLIPLSRILAKTAKNLNVVLGICVCLNIFFIGLPITTKLIWTKYDNTFDTHSRMINYTMGMMMGIFIRETQHKSFLYSKIKNLSIANFIIWILTFITLITTMIVYQEIIYTQKYTHTAQTLCWSLSRPIWCMGLSWIVYSTYHGYGGIVNWILSRPTLQITAKLSYCMYLMHGLVIAHSTLMTRTRTYFSDWFCFQYWCAYFIITYIIAFIWSLAFESPLLIIEKFIFGTGAPRRQRNSQKNHQVTQSTAAERNQKREIP